MSNLHKEFSAGGGPWRIRIWRIEDVAIWCIPGVMAADPRNVFLESLVKVKQWPRHDHVIVHWYKEWDNDAGKTDS